MHIFLLFKILACIFACLIDIVSTLTCHQCKDKDNNANCANSKGQIISEAIFHGFKYFKDFCPKMGKKIMGRYYIE